LYGSLIDEAALAEARLFMTLQSALFFESVEQIYARVFRVLRPSLPEPAIDFRFQKFTSATSRIRFREGVLRVRVSDLLQSAPSPVQESLAYILLSKLFRQRVPERMLNQYRMYLRRPEMQETIHATRRERGAKRVDRAEGSHFDLERVFAETNDKFFGGTIPKPQLGWSRTPSRSILGHYDAAHHAIVLSKLLDRPNVPAWVVEYVMFHEILHIKHPTGVCAGATGRRLVHSRTFRAEEKTYPRFAEVKEALRKL
jgi:hypothetical protein